MTQNRLIKFRAYLKAINKMVEVNEINWYENSDDKGNISSIRYAGETKYAHHYFEFDVNNDVILMQYTGYKDMNGKEIYEGDIVRYYDDIYEVKWMWAGFYIHSLQNGFDELATNENFVEVIGNIYENPELLNDEKEKV